MPVCQYNDPDFFNFPSLCRKAVQEAIQNFHNTYNFHNDLTSAHILFELEEDKRSKNITTRFISLSGFRHVEKEDDKEDTHKTSRLILRVKEVTKKSCSP